MRGPATYFKPLAEECQRFAVSAAYDVPFDSTPAIAGLTPQEAAYAWTRWATARGMRWWRSGVIAPIGLPRWLAGVDFRGPHEVAMAGDRLWRDPTGNVESVRLDQVEVAGWLWPADHRSLGGLRFAPINGAEIEADGSGLIARPVDEPGDVNRTVIVYTADRPPTPIRPQPRRNPEKVGRNDPCSCGSGEKFKRCCGR